MAPLSAISAATPADRPLKPGASGTAYTPDGLPALQPARGINADMLFAEKINDEGARFDRLETAVTDMRREFDSVKPAIVRLAAVEDDMQALLQQLETLVQNPPAPVENMPVESVALDAPLPENIPLAQAPPSASGMPAPLAVNASVPSAATAAVPVKPSVATAESKVIDGLGVQNLRIGEHDNMTRLVFDLTGPVKYKYDLDNTENLLVIELVDAAWAGKVSDTLKSSPLIQSWMVQKIEGEQGSRLIINLHKAVKISKESALSGPHRIMFDIQAGT